MHSFGYLIFFAVIARSLNLVFGALEHSYIFIKGKPFMKHVIFFKSKLPPEEQAVLAQRIGYYNETVA